MSVIHKSAVLWRGFKSGATLAPMDRPVIRSELYPFSYFDPVRKRWVKARYKAELSAIKARYSQWRLEGEPEIREGPLDPRVDPNGPHGQ